MAKIGSPFMTCDKQRHKRGDKHSNMYATLEEAYVSEKTGTRNCHDEDFDSGRTKYNIMLGGFDYVEEIEKYLDDRAMEYCVKVKSKDGKVHERKLRSDAKICGCMVIKCDCDYVDNLPLDQQDLLYLDAWNILSEECPKMFGFRILTGVIHKDEFSEHLHAVMFDDSFRLSHKADIRFKSWLNFEFPKLMAERGWDIQPNDCHYDMEHVKQLEEEGRTREVAEYKTRCIDRKKTERAGLSSRQYKAKREAERAEKNLEALEATALNKQKQILMLEHNISRLNYKVADKQMEYDDLCSKSEVMADALAHQQEDYRMQAGGQEKRLKQMFNEVLKDSVKEYSGKYQKQVARQIADDIANGLKLPARGLVKRVPKKMKDSDVMKRSNGQIVNNIQQAAPYLK